MKRRPLDRIACFLASLCFCSSAHWMCSSYVVCTAATIKHGLTYERPTTTNHSSGVIRKEPGHATEAGTEAEDSVEQKAKDHLEQKAEDEVKADDGITHRQRHIKPDAATPTSTTIRKTHNP